MRDEVVRYVLATPVSATCSLLVPIALHEGLGALPAVAVGVGLLFGFGLNFLISRLFVFRSFGTPGSEMLRFVVASLAFRLAEYSAFLLLNTVLAMHYVVALAIVLGASFVAKFLVQRTFVFRIGGSH